AEIVGMRAREAEAPHTGDGPDRAQQIREIMVAVVVRVHRLAEEHDLRHPLGDDRGDLAYDVVQAAAPFRTTRRRHDTVRAPVVAATLHRDPCFYFVEAARLEILVVLLEIEGRG